MGCTAKIRLHVSLDRQLLQIATADLKHIGHDDSQAFFHLLPSERRLSPKTRDDAAKFLQMRCNKKHLQNHILTKKYVHVTMKDLHNLNAKIRPEYGNDLAKARKLLEKLGADVHILHDQDKYKGLFFQTADMKTSFKSWPEIIFFDGTYKLSNTNMVLLLLLVEDSNCLGEIVGVALLVHEDYTSMKWFLNTFKAQNVDSKHIRCFMTDKDMVERKVIKEVFPHVSTYLCRFHVLKIFSRQVSTKNYTFTNAQKEQCLELLTKLLYSCSEHEYNVFYNKFLAIAPVDLAEYFNNNWHNIRNEWTTYSIIGTYGNYTNNRLESVNSKIKQLVQKKSDLLTFIRDFFKWVDHHNLENDVKAAKNFIVENINIENVDYAEKEYMKYLTIEAYKQVKQELDGRYYITFLYHNIPEKISFIKSKFVTIRVTIDTCQCVTWLSYNLPCRHIFAARDHLKHPLFQKDLCDKRWSKDYYKLTQRNYNKILNIETGNERATTKKVTVSKVVQASGGLSTSELRKKLNTILNDILDRGALSCGQNFYSKVRNMDDIVLCLTNGDEAVIETDHNSSASKENGLIATNNIKRKTLSVGEKRKILSKFIKNINILSKSWTKDLLKFNINILKQLYDAWLNETTIIIISKKSKEITNSICKETAFADKIKNLTISECCEAETIEEDDDTKIEKIYMPRKHNVKGRPKGSLVTAISLSAVKKNIPFTQKSNESKAVQLLNWLNLPEIMITNIVRQEYKVKSSDLDSNIQNLNDVFTNDNIDINILEKYCELQAFELLLKLVETKKKQYKQSCKICHTLGSFKTISCGICLNLFHYKCVSIKKKPRQTVWLCKNCQK